MTDRRDDDESSEARSLHDLAAAYALDAVDEAERRRFEAHLTGCEECRRTVAALGEATVALSEGLEEPPPAALRDRVLSVVAEEPRNLSPRQASAGRAPGEPAAVTPRSRRRLPGPGSWWLAAAAAAVIAVGAGVVATQWGQEQPGPAVAVQEVLDAEDARWSTETVDGSTVHVVRSTRLERTVLVAEEMPEAPAGQDYQLWFVHEDGTAVSAGLMPREEDERTEVVLEGDPAGAVAVGVTLEPEGGSAQPTSEPLVAVPLEG